MSVKRCPHCLGDTEYYCPDCNQELCYECKELHVGNLDTLHHYVMLYREKFDYLQTGKCEKHDKSNKEFCSTCDIPICFHCRKHRTHDKQDIIEAYKVKRKEQIGAFFQIRCEKLYKACAVHASLKTDVRMDVHSCHEQVCLILVGMQRKSQKLIRFFEDGEVQSEKRIECMKLFTRILQENITKMKKHIGKITTYEHKHALSSNKPVQFLKFIKKHRLPQIQNTPKVAKQWLFSLQGHRDVKNIMSFFSKIKRSTRRKRHPKKENLLEMCSPVIQTYVTIDGIDSCCHISYSTTDKIWISSDSDLILTNKTGEILHHVSNLLGELSGSHTVNGCHELIYIANNFSINKISSNNESSMVSNLESSLWKARCLYYSYSTGNVLVVMKKNDSELYKVVFYNKDWQCVRTIQQNDPSINLYRNPIFITENINGNVVVSDSKKMAVVVTDRRGTHRFTYTGPQSKYGLDPRGLCCDALSNILVCDIKTNTVQIIDEDGQFLSILLGESRGISEPISLSYDPNNHVIWVGSLDNNTVSVYRYLNKFLNWIGTCIQ